MMRSLFSAISGLKGHQTMMDVVGNNIANVNTTAFKSGRITFQDIISQTAARRAGPERDAGGLNPMQVGLGMQTGSIDTLTPRATCSRPASRPTWRSRVTASSRSRTAPTRSTPATATSPIDSLVADPRRDRPDGGPGRHHPGRRHEPQHRPERPGHLDASAAAVTTGPIITLANFANPAGLTRTGNNLFQASNNSGPARRATPGTARPRHDPGPASWRCRTWTWRPSSRT